MADFDSVVDALKEKAEQAISEARRSTKALDEVQHELNELSKMITQTRKEITKQSGSTGTGRGRGRRKASETQPQVPTAAAA